jgi:hypothetical protein
MDLLNEVVQDATAQMLKFAYHPPTLFISGTKSRMGYTFTTFQGNMEQQTSAMTDIGKEMVQKHPELGTLEHVFFVTHITGSVKKEGLIIHGLEISTNKQSAVAYEVIRDKQKNFRELKHIPIPQETVPDNPWIRAFVTGFQEVALAGKN